MGKIKTKRFVARSSKKSLVFGLGCAQWPVTTINQPANTSKGPMRYVKKLGTREEAMIDRLIEICTRYEEQGQNELSQIVDRIGVKMMQAFIQRPNYQQIVNEE